MGWCGGCFLRDFTQFLSIECFAGVMNEGFQPNQFGSCVNGLLRWPQGFRFQFKLEWEKGSVFIILAGSWFTRRPYLEKDARSITMSRWVTAEDGEGLLVWATR